MMTLKNDVELVTVEKQIAKCKAELEQIKSQQKDFKYSDRVSDAYAELCEKEIFTKYKLSFLKENAIVVAGSYCLTLFAEIFNKYENKPLGEKTKEKIYNEFYEATNKRFKVYVSEGRDINFISMNPKTGFSAYDFEYKELDFYLQYGTSYKNNENKAVKISLENISQYHGIKEYKDATKAAKEFLKTARKAQKMAAELNTVIAELNKLHPQKNSWIKEYNEVRYIDRL